MSEQEKRDDASAALSITAMNLIPIPGTPIDDAVRHGRHEVVKYLETKGGQRIAATAHEWATKLCDAAARSDIAQLKRLADKGAHVDMADYDKRTALHLSASEGLLPVVKFLIEECGADPNPVDRWNGKF